MTSTPADKRMSVDVSDLVDQLRPYTPQANSKTFRDPPLNSFDGNTPSHVFTSPLPPSGNRGKPTAEEAAKVLLEDDPFLNLRSSPVENPMDPPCNNGHPQSQVINIQAPSAMHESSEQRDRVSASFQVRAPAAALAFSPVLPRVVNEPLPPTEALVLSTAPSSPSYPLTNTHSNTPTPVSAAKPPRPPVPRLQPLHSSEQQSQVCPSPAPSTPFGSAIPLSYSAVKTPGAASLHYLGETPASAKQSNDPSSMVEFFRSRSAHVTSPIFSTRKKIDVEDLGSPEVRINPLADSVDDLYTIPPCVIPEVVVRMEFSLGYGFDRAEDADLSSRANRVPILYSVVVRTTDLDGDIRPAFARLERDSDSPHTMLVDVVEDRVKFERVEDSLNSVDGISDNNVHEAVLTFWAAPDSFIQFGSATLLLTVIDEDETSHETKVELHVIGTEPVLAVEARENHPEPERKETTVVFGNSRNCAQEGITIWNQTFGGAPLLINALITDSASDSFTIRDKDGQVSDCIPMMIPGGKSYTFTACFELMPNVTLRGRYYGCVLLKLATLLPSKKRHSSSDIDLHQFYDHVVNFEAHIAGVAPIDRLSTLEDPSSNNIEEMLYEHRYGNDYDNYSSQLQYGYGPGQHSHRVDRTSYERSQDESNYSGGDDPEADGVLERLSLVTSPKPRESLPEGFETKPFLICEYNLHEPPRWVSPDEEFIESGFDDGPAESVDTEIKEPQNKSEDESTRFEDSSAEIPERTEVSRDLRYTQESYEEWKKSLEDADNAPSSYDEGEQGMELGPDEDRSCIEDVPERLKRVSTQNESVNIEDVPEDDRRVSNQDVSVGYISDKMSEQACDQKVTKDGKTNNSESCSEEPERKSSGHPAEESVEQKLQDSSHLSSLGESYEERENGIESVQVPTSHDQRTNRVSVAKATDMSPRCSADATRVDAVKSSSPVGTAPQGPSFAEPACTGKATANHEKPPLPTKMKKKTALDGRIGVPQDGGTLRPGIFSPRKQRTFLVEDPVDGVRTRNKKNLKGIIETVGAAVEGLRPDQGFLKQYTQFDSNFNMSDDLSARPSRNISLSSAGSFASLNPHQRPGIHNLTARWGLKKSNDVRYKPKLRIPRKLLEKGLSIAADSGSAKLTVCNGSLTTIRVDISAKQGLNLKGQILIQPQFLALRPEQKSIIRLTRLTSEQSKTHVVLACSNLHGPENLTCTYRLPVVVEAAKNRVPTVQGFAVDRPTLTFYNPKSTARHCRVRVLNGTKRKVSYKVWVGKNKEHAPHYESAFTILSHHEGTVESQKCFSVIVVFDALGQTDHFHERLYISVGRKTDYIPMFGYGGASNMKFSRSERGHLRAQNFGCRYGFLILSGPEVDSPENAITRVTLAPGETGNFVPPYGSGTIIFTGDEIARTRLCRSQEVLETESDEKSDENSLFLGHFSGQERAAEEERLFWDEENKHSLHYAGRLMDSNTRRFMFDTYSEDVVPYVERNREIDLSWHASLDSSRFIHIENYDSKHELAFTAVGAEPNAGSIPPLGDAVVAAFAETVQVYARGQCRELNAETTE